jgi:hypothetical protein
MTETNDDEMRTISDEEWDNPKPLEGKALETHQENVTNLRKLVVSFVIFKIGFLALVAVLVWKFFGQHR